MRAKYFLLALCVGCASEDELQRSSQYFSDANYYQAFAEISELREQRPEDPEIEQRYWEIRVAFLLSQGRDLIFANREGEALPVLERVLVLDPENEIAPEWIAKAREKLALRAVDRADSLAAAGELTEALRAYHEAIEYLPGLERAEAGIAKLDATWADQRRSARERYLKGVREMSEQQYSQANYQMDIALGKDPLLDSARSQKAVALARIAEQRFAEAKSMEDQGFYAPALKDYMFVREIAPETTGVEDAIARMEREVDASEKMRAGETAILRGRFDEARELLEAALELTSYQQVSIADKLRFVTLREMERRYVDARDFEIQYDFESALDAYRAIEEDFSGFSDVRARITDLEASIEAAANSHAAGMKAEEAGEIDAAIGHYREALIYWPGYKGLDTRVRQLERREGTR